VASERHRQWYEQASTTTLMKAAKYRNQALVAGKRPQAAAGMVG